MTITELIEELESARDEMGDVEVRIAYQPSWPLRGTIAAVTVPRDEPYEEDEQAPGQASDDHMLWIAVGPAPYEENPYGPRWAWTGGES